MHLTYGYLNVLCSRNAYSLKLTDAKQQNYVTRVPCFNENVWISIELLFKFDPEGSINNIPILGLIMAWRRPGDKLLSEPIIIMSYALDNGLLANWLRAYT